MLLLCVVSTCIYIVVGYTCVSYLHTISVKLYLYFLIKPSIIKNMFYVDKHGHSSKAVDVLLLFE